MKCRTSFRIEGPMVARHVTAKVLTITALVGALALTACGSGSSSGARSPDNTVVKVTEKEWSITPDIKSVAAGKVSFVVINKGKADHEMVLLKADKAAATLTSDSTGKVNETAVGANVGEVEVEASTTGAGTFNLAPGHYVMICNIPMHYQQGMSADFTVTGTPVLASQKPAAPAATAPAAAKATTAPGERKETGLLKVVGPLLENTLAAAQKGDIPGARKALHQYDVEWHGVEVYLNFRSAKLYGELETTDQAALTKLLDDPKSSQADIVTASQELLNKWDESLKLMTSSPAISPIFDDLAAIRILKAETINEIDPLLKAGDVAAAKGFFTNFVTRWADIEDLVKSYSVDAYADTEASMGKANTAFQKSKPEAAELQPLVADTLVNFNFGQSLVNAAARGADTTKTAFTTDDVQMAAKAAAIQAELKASLPLWQAGKYPDAASHAGRAAGELFTTVSAPLKAKSADAALKKALDDYTALSGKAGDAAVVAASEKAAVWATAVAQQWLVGQFWTDPKFKDALLKAP